MSRTRASVLTIAALSAALCGCDGSIIGGSSGPRGDAPAGDASQPPTPPDTPAAGGAPGSPERSPLRRLNNAELDNTLRDLLGDTSNPTKNLPADVATVFDNDANVQNLSADVLEALQNLADDVAARTLIASSPMHARFFVCQPTGFSDSTCIDRLLRTVMRRAFRRPVDTAEVEAFAKPITAAQMRGDSLQDGLQAALSAILLSPSFLFRVELDGQATGTHAISDLELATRLSYFMWSSMPDEQLLSVAEAGDLSDPTELETQIKRLMADPKAAVFAERFFSQFLALQALADAQPDAATYSKFDEALRSAFFEETRITMGALMQGGSYRDLFTSTTTYANARLATHYGLPSLTGTAMQKVSLAGSKRSGLLGHGSILTMTSAPNRTSPVKRGAWVLTQLLCSAPPPPPPNVEAVLPPTDASTTRELLAQHRANPSCAGCHNLMDPIGLGLENYDGVGAWRDTEAGHPVDATGSYTDGTPFDGPQALGAKLTTDPRLTACLVQRMLGFALGRSVGKGDQSTVTALDAAFVKEGTSVPALLAEVAKSEAFKTRLPGATP